MSFSTSVPDGMPVWRVEVDPALADELRREFGSEQRAARVEEDWQSSWGSPPPADARVLRVEADEPVVVLVEKFWPQADYGYRAPEKWRFLRALEPVAPGPEGYSMPASLNEVAWLLREVGALTDDPEVVA